MTYPILVLNEPHASIEGLYDNELSFWNIDARFINEVVFRLTDWHTDFLFHGFRDARIRPVRFPYSRFVVDAERLWNDPLEQEGQGILYRRFGGYCRTIPQQCAMMLEVNKRVYMERGTLYLKTRHPQKRSVSDLMALLMGRLVGV